MPTYTLKLLENWLPQECKKAYCEGLITAEVVPREKETIVVEEDLKLDGVPPGKYFVIKVEHKLRIGEHRSSQLESIAEVHAVDQNVDNSGPLL